MFLMSTLSQDSHNSYADYSHTSKMDWLVRTEESRRLRTFLPLSSPCFGTAPPHLNRFPHCGTFVSLHPHSNRLTCLLLVAGRLLQRRETSFDRHLARCMSFDCYAHSLDLINRKPLEEL